MKTTDDDYDNEATPSTPQNDAVLEKGWKERRWIHARRYRVILLIFIFIHLFLCVYIHYIVSSFKALFFYTTHRPVPLLCQLFKAPIFFKKLIFLFLPWSPPLSHVSLPHNCSVTCP